MTCIIQVFVLRKLLTGLSGIVPCVDSVPTMLLMVLI